MLNPPPFGSLTVLAPLRVKVECSREKGVAVIGDLGGFLFLSVSLLFLSCLVWNFPVFQFFG